LLLRLLAFGYVLHGSGQPGIAARRRLAFELAPHLNPALLPVAGAHDAVLRAQGQAFFQRFSVPCQHALAVVWVQCIHPGAQPDAARCGQAVDLARDAREKKLLVLRIPGKKAHRGGLLGAFQPAHVAFQFLLEGALAPTCAPLPVGGGQARQHHHQAHRQAQGQPFALQVATQGLFHMDL
jgi:hypothetical protein